jgi:hypothetical protein
MGVLQITDQPKRPLIAKRHVLTTLEKKKTSPNDLGLDSGHKLRIASPRRLPAKT